MNNVNGGGAVTSTVKATTGRTVGIKPSLSLGPFQRLAGKVVIRNRRKTPGTEKQKRDRRKEYARQTTAGILQAWLVSRQIRGSYSWVKAGKRPMIQQAESIQD